MILLRGLGIGGYRSFRSHVRIGPFAKINIFVGGNNTGKSNILRFLRDHLATAIKATTANVEFQLDPQFDVPLNSNAPFSLSVAHAEGDIDHLKNLKAAKLGRGKDEILKALLSAEPLKDEHGLIWFDYVATGDGKRNLVPDLPFERLEPPTNTKWQDLSMAIAQRSSSDRKENIAKVYEKIRPSFSIAAPYFVPAIREVKEGELLHEDFSGAGLIDRLVQLRDPTFGNEADEERFHAITNFVRQVIGNNSVELRIPHDRERILIRMDDKTLPLESLGTGIHEVVILAAAGTVLKNQIVCIEEPEIHLHPILQRRLLEYLQNHTHNQYFIATHSAHLIDTDGATVFHVMLEEGTTEVSIALKAHERFAICRDLGYRASDLMQANAVIWVEGPSDRIYLNHWLASLYDYLVEGVHYSIMWYGGRLLSHLSTTEEVEEFIQLRRLNRNAVVVMDSDKGKPQAKINLTKKRIKSEFDGQDAGFAWITAGREIENYVDRSILVQALEAVKPEYAVGAGVGKFDRAIPMPDDGYRYDKLRVAREVATRDANLDVLDLRQKLVQLANFILHANGIPT